MVAVLDEGAFDLLGRLIAVRGFDAVANAAHVNLRCRRAFAGVKALGGQDDIKLPIVTLENIAFADGAGDDFHVCRSLLREGAPQRLQRALDEIRRAPY